MDPARLGCYVLPGAAADPRRAITEGIAAQNLGFGTAFVGERYDTKDLPSLIGALSQTTERIRLCGAITHIGTRHPMSLAAMGQTLQALTGGRFLLGLGRGALDRWRAYGVTPPTNAMLGDTARILRRLWAGETVTYDGPAGTFPELRVIERPPFPPPPLLLAGVGPATLTLAGEAFDGAILHPLLSPDAVAAAVQRVRAGAEAAGRDPAAVEIHATVLCASDEEAPVLVGGRGLGYLLMRGLGDALAEANGWSSARLAEARDHPRFRGLSYAQLKRISNPELAGIATAVPSDWFHATAAIGDPATISARLAAYLDTGVTGLLLHGTTAGDLSPVMQAWRDR